MKDFLKTLKITNILHLKVLEKENAVAIGTAPVPEIIFSLGTAADIAWVLTKIQSSQNFSKADTPIPFISQL